MKMTVPLNRIDFDSNIPYYVQLIALIKANINQQVWKSGDQIPGEPELCVAYGISRTVVRQALKELELDGIITRRKGKGTFVSEPKISEGLVQKLTGFYQDMVERGLKPVTQVLRQEIVPANERVAKYLEIPQGMQVVEIKRLRSVSDEPIQIVTTYIPYTICPELATIDLSNRSLYEFLEKSCGIVLTRARRFVEAVAANEAEARLLKIERGSPLLMLDSISCIADGTPVEYYHALHRGDRSRFEVDLARKLSQNGAPSDLDANFANLSTNRH
jgi:GntR family transcriptional regulator